MVGTVIKPIFILRFSYFSIISFPKHFKERSKAPPWMPYVPAGQGEVTSGASGGHRQPGVPERRDLAAGRKGTKAVTGWFLQDATGSPVITCGTFLITASKEQS